MQKYNLKILRFLILSVTDKVMKTKVAFYYKDIKRMQTLNKQEITQWQNLKLRELIKHAYENTKYYKELFTKINLKPDDIKSISDLEKLPILTKDDIRGSFTDLIPFNIELIPHIKSSTGGSSGNPLIFLLDKISWSYSSACYIYNWEKVGYNYGDKYIALGSTSLFVNKKMSLKHILYYKFKNKIGLNGINMSDKVCKEYVELIKRKNIHFIYGYASSIYLLAKYVINSNDKLKIIACFPTSEVLTDLYRETISEAFKCKILNSYSASDGGIIAFEHQKGFFEVGYNSIVTIKNLDENCITPALLTDLFNYAMPLINYQLGDELIINKNKNVSYPYNGQIINKVLGRTSDVINLENGNVLTGPGFTILFKDLPVEYYCIEKNGINSINCSIKKLPEFNLHHENVVISTIKKQMGSNSILTVSYTEEVKLTKSGKRQYFITQ